MSAIHIYRFYYDSDYLWKLLHASLFILFGEFYIIICRQY